MHDCFVVWAAVNRYWRLRYISSPTLSISDDHDNKITKNTLASERWLHEHLIEWEFVSEANTNDGDSRRHIVLYMWGSEITSYQATGSPGINLIGDKLVSVVPVNSVGLETCGQNTVLMAYLQQIDWQRSAEQVSTCRQQLVCGAHVFKREKTGSRIQWDDFNRSSQHEEIIITTLVTCISATTAIGRGKAVEMQSVDC